MARDPYLVLGVERDVAQAEIAAACCAPFTIFMGASTGVMLGSAAGWLRKAGFFRAHSHRSEDS